MTWPASMDLLASLAPWFEGVKREMPWRAKDLDCPHPDPYAVLVSEVMLQQTQVATVIPYFERWMARFPNAASLAMAEEGAVHKAWEGLGYYRRCRFLQAAATRISKEGWPVDLAGLQSLPGLGPYTAAALGAIAFQWPTPALDGNAFRVLSRLLLIEGDPKREAATLRNWLRSGLIHLGPSRLSQALMELGATVCLPQPRCAQCPLALRCEANRQGRTEEIPPLGKRALVTEQDLWLLAVEAQGAFLLRRPQPKGLLAGLWRWPVLASPPQKVLDAVAEDPLEYQEVEAWEGWTQVYSHRKEKVSPLHFTLGNRFEAPEGCAWIEATELPSLALGRRDSKLRDLLKFKGQTPLSLPFEWLNHLCQAMGSES